VLLGEDETVLRLFPVLRRAWALQGEQAHVAITGCNAKRVLFGAINLRTGHRIILRRPNMEQVHFQAFLRLLREAYPGHRIALLLDEAPSHRAAKSLSENKAFIREDLRSYAWQGQERIYWIIGRLPYF
jgi:DDE superfamily endonuclease